jgi:hypothetical protein
MTIGTNMKFPQLMIEQHFVRTGAHLFNVEESFDLMKRRKHP